MNQTTYTIYNLSTGEILRQITAPEEIVLLNVATDEGYVEGDGDPKTQVVVDGQMVSKPVEDLEQAKRQEQIALVLQTRQSLLMASDWTQLPDVPLATKEAWAEYRQALRDVTKQPDPFTIQWPTMPE